jgi:hypothetical protein
MRQKFIYWVILLLTANVALSFSSPVKVRQAQYWVSDKHVKRSRVDIRTDAVLAVRSGPGKQYSLLDCLPDETQIISLERKNGWIRISPPARFPSGSAWSYWISDACVKNNRVSVGTKAALPVQSGPGMQYSRCGYLLDGEQISILGIQNGWIRIATPSQRVSPNRSLVHNQPASQLKSVTAPVTVTPSVQTLVCPPIDNLILNGDFSSTALALPSIKGNSTRELSGHWLRSSQSSWELLPHGGNFGAYVRAPAYHAPCRLLYLATDSGRSTGSYVLQFDYVLKKSTDTLGVKVFVSDRDVSVGTGGGDFMMDAHSEMRDLIMLPVSPIWATYRVPVELGNGYDNIYVLFCGTGMEHTGIDNVSLSPVPR